MKKIISHISEHWLISFIISSLLLFILLCVVAISTNSEVLELINSNMSCRHYDSRIGFVRMKANCDGVRNIGEGDVPLHINSQGFHEREFGLRPKPGIKRVLLLGGSNLTGIGLSSDSNPSLLIENDLKKMGFPKVEVLNFSIEGYTTTQHALLIKYYLDTYLPDIVILHTTGDYKIFRDAVMYKYLKLNYAGTNFVKLRTFKEIMPSWLFAIVSYNQTVESYLRTILEAYRHFFLSWQIKMAKDEKSKRELILYPTLSLLKKIHSQCKKRNVSLFLIFDGIESNNKSSMRLIEKPLIYKLLRPFIPNQKITTDEMRMGFLSAGVPVFDLTDALPRESRKYYIKDTKYYSKLGMEIFSEEMARKLASVPQIIAL
jgi:hypothetical protein